MTSEEMVNYAIDRAILRTLSGPSRSQSHWRKLRKQWREPASKQRTLTAESMAIAASMLRGAA
jgi:hypothetical protein